MKVNCQAKYGPRLPETYLRSGHTNKIKKRLCKQPHLYQALAKVKYQSRAPAILKRSNLIVHGAAPGHIRYLYHAPITIWLKHGAHPASCTTDWVQVNCVGTRPWPILRRSKQMEPPCSMLCFTNDASGIWRGGRTWRSTPRSPNIRGQHIPLDHKMSPEKHYRGRSWSLINLSCCKS